MARLRQLLVLSASQRAKVAIEVNTPPHLGRPSAQFAQWEKFQIVSARNMRPHVVNVHPGPPLMMLGLLALVVSQDSGMMCPVELVEAVH